MKIVDFRKSGQNEEKTDKAVAGDATQIVEEFKKNGIKVLNWYWKLGRYDTVFIFEAASEKEALKTSIDLADFVATEPLSSHTETRGSEPPLRCPATSCEPR